MIMETKKENRNSEGPPSPHIAWIQWTNSIPGSPVTLSIWHDWDQARSRGGGRGVGRPPPQLPIPKNLNLNLEFPPFSNFVPPFSNFVPPFSKPMQSVCDRGRPITTPPLGLGMWMTSHGQCPRGGAVFQFFGGQMTSRGQCPRGVPVNVQEWGRFSNWWRHADNVQGGGGCAWCSIHPSSDPPPPHTWLAGYGPAGIQLAYSIHGPWNASYDICGVHTAGIWRQRNLSPTASRHNDALSSWNVTGLFVQLLNNWKLILARVHA